MLSFSQVQLVEQYMPLARKLAFSFYRSGRMTLPLQDYESEARLGLVVAAQRYDSSVSSFMTFAHRIVTSKLIDLYNHEKRSRATTFVELGIVHEKEYDEAIYALSSKTAIFEEGYANVEFEDMVRKFVASISPEERFLFLSRADGKTQQEIAILMAERFGDRKYRQGYVCTMLQELKKKYVAFMNNC